jgi:SAM-dependent methyltransferase
MNLTPKRPEKLEWDYTALADAYLYRPSYSDSLIDEVLGYTKLVETDRIADIGAGTGNLTGLLLERGFRVNAVEPNDAMRIHGMARTVKFGDLVTWSNGVAEFTKLPRGIFGMVTFGSSFNVTNRSAALAESFDLLQSGGWLMCCWNHRDMTDAKQQCVQDIIQHLLPKYSPGTRSEDQTQVILESGLFEKPRHLSSRVNHRLKLADWLEAWRSHATLIQQAGDRFDEIIREIAGVFAEDKAALIEVPYITEAWLARRKDRPM